jgi:acyl-CoA synthetase (NDP forming)
VAVVGASRDPARLGHRVLRNLIDGGFAGPVYPVNPGAGQVAVDTRIRLAPTH